jgi:hypothetical protein
MKVLSVSFKNSVLINNKAETFLHENDSVFRFYDVSVNTENRMVEVRKKDKSSCFLIPFENIGSISVESSKEKTTGDVKKNSPVDGRPQTK